MKRIPIFRAGKHTPTSGAALDFSTDDLKAAVAAYDPSLHEAPIVVGHPKDNLPAYGWVKSLEYDEGTGEIIAIPDQLDADFSEMVGAGRFKKRSASWYLPDSPANPKPGTLYLRHVGFLGAQPPAVKGLKPVEFSEAEGVVEFGDSENRWAFGSLASIARSFREWIIGEKDLETADKVIPNYLINDIERAAQAPASDSPAAVPAFSEPDVSTAVSLLKKAVELHQKHMDGKAPTTGPDGEKSQQKLMDQIEAALAALNGKQSSASVDMSEGEDPMNIAELQAQVARLTAENATLNTQVNAVANFAEREATLTTREAAVAAKEAKQAQAAIETRVDAAIAAGKVLKAQRAQIVAFAASLADGEQAFDFAEGDKTVKVSQREIYLRGIEAGPKLVDFGERSGEDGKRDDKTVDLAEAEANLWKQVATGKA